MNCNQQNDSVHQAFIASVMQFCKDTDGLYYDISKEYTGEELPKNLKCLFGRIFYRSFCLKFIYTAHGMLEACHSILTCSFSFEKSDDALYIPLPLLTDYLDLDVLVPLTIPYITSSAGMGQAFDCIGNVIKANFDLLEQSSLDTDAMQRITATYINEMRITFKLKETDAFDAEMESLVHDYFVLRLAAAPFINRMKGKNAKAIKQLTSTKHKVGYESRQLRLWAENPVPDVTQLDAILPNLKYINDFGVENSNIREFIALFLSWFILLPATTLPYLAIFGAIVAFDYQNAVILLGPADNFPLCIVAGFITAIAVSYFTRHTIYKFMFRKDYERFKEFDQMQNGGKEDKLMKRFLVVIVILGIATSVLFAKWNINFQKDGFVDNSKFFSVTGVYHPYTEIEKVYYLPNRTNAFNEVIEIPSYVIVLIDGTEIDLHEHGNVENYENALIDHLRNCGVTVETNLE